MFTKLADLATRHSRRVVILAVVLAVAAAALGGNVATRLAPYGADDPASDSYKTSQAIKQATGVESAPRIVVLVRDQTPARVAHVAAVLRADRGIGRVSTYYDTHNRALLSNDGRATYLGAWIKRTADDEDTAGRVK